MWSCGDHTEKRRQESIKVDKHNLEVPVSVSGIQGKLSLLEPRQDTSRVCSGISDECNALEHRGRVGRR